MTDASGAFLFEDVAPGKHAVTLSGAKITATPHRGDVRGGQAARRDLRGRRQETAPGEERDDLEIVVVAPPIRKQVVSTEVSADQGRRDPRHAGRRAQGRREPPRRRARDGRLRAARGVGRGAAGHARLRGRRAGAAALSRRRPALGDRSDLVRSVELSPGGYGAAYGRGLGGLVTVPCVPSRPTGFTARSRRTCSTPRRWCAPITDKLRFAVAGRARATSTRCCRSLPPRTRGRALPDPPLRGRPGPRAYALAPAHVDRGRWAALARHARSHGRRAADPSARRSRVAPHRLLGPRVRALSAQPRAATALDHALGRRGQLVAHEPLRSATPTELSWTALVFGLRATHRRGRSALRHRDRRPRR